MPGPAACAAGTIYRLCQYPVMPVKAALRGYLQGCFPPRAFADVAPSAILIPAASEVEDAGVNGLTQVEALAHGAPEVS